jgi:preprotein translocase subunit SecE
MGRRRGSTATRGARGTQQKKKQGFAAGPRKFARDVQGELRRVSWPNRDQLRQSTAVVLVIVLTLGVYVAAWDFVFKTLARLIFG